MKIVLYLRLINLTLKYLIMKKLFILFALAGFVVASCGNNTPKEEPKEESAVVEKADSTAQEVTDSTAVVTETEVKEESAGN